MIDKVGLIPLKDYIHGLSYRGLGRQDSILYTQDTYNINLEKEIANEGLWFDGDINIYKQYDQKYPTEIEDDGSRDYFEKYARKRFLKMIKIYDLENRDYFFPSINSDVVHHIYPLVYSKDNSVFNLIQINNIFHSILHNNPLENHKEFNYQAVDYLWYLCHSGFNYLDDKYKLSQYLDPNKIKTLQRIFYGGIEDEMDYFYKSIA